MSSEKYTNKFEGFVLAGGKSSRMKTDKAFLRFGDETFLEHAFNALSQACEKRVKIILNRNQSAEKISYQYVRDVFDERGAPGAIHAALANSKSEWTIILACDLPLVTSETILELSEIALKSPKNIAAIVPKESGGKIQPLCAVYRSSFCLPRLEELLKTQNSVSVQDFLKAVPTFYFENKKTSIREESMFFNVNTPADFKFLTKKNL
jgi:molybdopterin-guanine dinucleotide biosynthesis protein A